VFAILEFALFNSRAESRQTGGRLADAAFRAGGFPISATVTTLAVVTKWPDWASGFLDRDQSEVGRGGAWSGSSHRRPKRL